MFHGLNLDSQPDVVLPLSAVQFIGLQPLAEAQFNLYVRLLPGITPSVAAKRAEPLLRKGVEESFHGSVPPIPAAAIKSQLEFTASLLSLEHGASQLRGLFSKAVVFLMGAVVVLLFIVCFNVGGLLLAKSQARRREFAIRRSLGATGFRIVRQMMAEGFLLGVLGTMLGLCLAYVLAPVLLRLIPVLRNPATQLVISPAIDLSPDWRILLFISGGCLVSGMLFGMLPAFAGLRFDLNSELKQLTGSKAHTAVTANALVCLQVMLTVVLITASGLMLRSYWNLLHATTGFDGDHVVTFRISPVAAGYSNEQIRGYYDRLLQRVRALPEIRAASLVLYGVMREKGIGAVVSPTGQAPGPGTFQSTSLNMVTPGYFDTMGIRLLEGRDLRPDDGDVKKPPFSVVVDETFARTFFAGQDVIGRTFGNVGAPPTYRIVGLVTTAKYRSLREEPPPTFYAHPIWGNPAAGMLNLYVRTYGDPRSVISRVRKSVQIADPNVPIVEITTLEMEERNSVWQERVVMLMTAFFGIAGLTLAGIGLYGTLTQFVVQHIREIGIRMALGAQIRHIVRAVCLSSMWSVTVGLVLGLAVSAAALRFAGAFLYELSPFDPWSYILAIGLILTAALLAASLPVSQAIKLDPASVLRAE
jgi:predicted permease